MFQNQMYDLKLTPTPPIDSFSGTYIHMNAREWKHFRIGKLAGGVAVELQLTTIEFCRVKWGSLQVVHAPQHHMLAPPHRRWFDD